MDQAACQLTTFLSGDFSNSKYIGFEKGPWYFNIDIFQEYFKKY